VAKILYTWGLGRGQQKVIYWCIQEGQDERDLYFHIILSSHTFGVIAFRGSGFIIHREEGCIVRAVVYSLYSGMTLLYVECSVI